MSFVENGLRNTSFTHSSQPFSSLLSFMPSSLPACKYGSACYRTNPGHLREYYHPEAVPGAGWARFQVPAQLPLPPPPPCKYGSACYRMGNPNHVRRYSHGGGGAHGGGGGGGGAVVRATPCKYGSACYRMGNPNHVRRYSHPAGNTAAIYTMYHGTSRASAEEIERHGFTQSTDGMLGRGVYASRDRKKAEAYKKGPDGVVLELRVRPGRTKKIDRQGHELQKTWYQAGYDSAWVPPGTMNPSGMQENCIWDPSRITIVRRIP